MMFTAFVLGVLAVHAQLPLVSAGEFLVHNNTACTGSLGSYVDFAVSQSFSCLTFPASYNYAAVQSATVIDPACTVQVYFDSKCQNLAHTVSTSTGTGKCLAVSGNIQGMTATCKPSKAVPRDVEQTGSAGEGAARLFQRAAVSYALTKGNIFYQPAVLWNGLSSGNRSKQPIRFSRASSYIVVELTITLAAYLSGNATVPQGSRAQDAVYLTEQLLNSAAANPKNTSIIVKTTTPSGVQYGTRVNANTVVTAIQMTGPAVFASLYTHGKS